MAGGKKLKPLPPEAFDPSKPNIGVYKYGGHVPTVQEAIRMANGKDLDAGVPSSPTDAGVPYPRDAQPAAGPTLPDEPPVPKPKVIVKPGAGVTVPQQQAQPQQPAMPAEVATRISLPSGSTTTTTSTPEVSAETFKAAQALAEKRKARASQLLVDQNTLLNRNSELIKNWRVDLDADKAKYGDRANALYDKFNRVSASLERTLVDLQKSKIDPQRYVKGLSGWQKFFYAFSALGAGFAFGMSRGKVNMPDALETAINRDLAAQRINLQNKLASAKIQDSVANKVLRQFQINSDLKKTAALQISKLQLAEIGVESKRIDVKNKVADMIDGIDAKLIDLKAKTEPKQVTRKTTGYRTQVVKLKTGAAGQAVDKPLNRDFVKKFAGAYSAVKEANRVAEKIKNYSWWGSKTPLTETQSKILDSRLDVLAVQLRRAYEKGVMTEPDYQRYRGLLKGDWKTAQSRNTLAMRIKEVQDILRTGVSSMTEVYRTAGVPTQKFEALLGNKGSARDAIKSQFEKGEKLK